VVTSDPFDRIGPAPAGADPEKPPKGHDPDPAVFIPAMSRDKTPPLRSGWGPIGSPVAVWEYLNAAGEVVRAVLRFTKADGSKDIRPATLWRSPGGRVTWKLKKEPKGVLSPLYGLNRLAAKPEAVALVVEGEKTADAAAILFPDFAVVTWPGGSNAVGHADWSPLAGRVVIAFPDADEPGRKAAAAVVQAVIKAKAHSAAAVYAPDRLPKGWDLADNWPEGFGLADATRIIQDALSGATGAPEADPARRRRTRRGRSMT
jgi:hypothetical protein